MEVWDKGTKWRIGNGASVRFWLDCWVDGKPLRNIIYRPLPAHEDSRLVNSVMMPNGEWNFTSLPFELLQSIRESIQGLPTGLSRDTPYSIIWGPSKDGKFSTKFAYLLHHDHPELRMTVGIGYGNALPFLVVNILPGYATRRGYLLPPSLLTVI
ncbi:hypothetical protein CRG98_035263 [Punica granatum]|uniref:Reverse transcriptase zinc-binding domain-containing protein n=1 Tax=Punica granatum TaxID=22663 RepID=A0A2I0IK28_PUNGR|nr:hypothetical protein CRG98_035263 [Punica granatum]